MSKFEFKLNSDGVKELLKCEAMQDILTAYAADVQSRAGSDYETVLGLGKARSYVNVRATTQKAYWKNIKENELLKALGGGKK